jgi:hypothetical protein
MNSFLQPSVKNYLIEALQMHLTSNPANEYYNTLKNYYVISEAEDGSTRANAKVDAMSNMVDPRRDQPMFPGQQSVDAYKKTKAPKLPKTPTKDVIPVDRHALDTMKDPSKIKLPYGVGGGGSGKGGRKGIDDKNDNKSMGGILFNDQNGTDIPAAVGLYGVGKIADTAADAIDAFGGQAVGDALSRFIPAGLGNVPVVGSLAKSAASKVISGIPGTASKILRQVSDISGANWFDANIANIGNSANELAAQGAGSPWTKLLVPKTSKNPLTPYDPFKERKQKVADAQFAAKEKKLGLTP